MIGKDFTDPKDESGGMTLPHIIVNCEVIHNPYISSNAKL